MVSDTITGLLEILAIHSILINHSQRVSHSPSRLFPANREKWGRLSRVVSFHYGTKQSDNETSYHSLSHELGCEWVSEWINAVKLKQAVWSKQMSGADERANGPANGPVLSSRFMAVLNHSAFGTRVINQPATIIHEWKKKGRKKRYKMELLNRTECQTGPAFFFLFWKDRAIFPITSFAGWYNQSGN